MFLNSSCGYCVTTSCFRKQKFRNVIPKDMLLQFRGIADCERYSLKFGQVKPIRKSVQI